MPKSKCKAVVAQDKLTAIAILWRLPKQRGLRSPVRELEIGLHVFPTTPIQWDLRKQQADPSRGRTHLHQTLPLCAGQQLIYWDETDSELMQLVSPPDQKSQQPPYTKRQLFFFFFFSFFLLESGSKFLVCFLHFLFACLWISLFYSLLFLYFFFFFCCCSLSFPLQSAV